MSGLSDMSHISRYVPYMAYVLYVGYVPIWHDMSHISPLPHLSRGWVGKSLGAAPISISVSYVSGKGGLRLVGHTRIAELIPVLDGSVPDQRRFAACGHLQIIGVDVH